MNIIQLITAPQCRAARALLDWSQPVLGEKCGLHTQTISNFEKGAKIPSKRTLETITRTLQTEGIVFLEDDGVQRKASRVITHYGQDGFRAFMDDVYDTVKITGGEICLLNGNPADWINWLGSDWYELHTARMQTLLDQIDVKIIIREGEYNFIGRHHAEYRWVPKKIWHKNSFYVYSDKIGFVNFDNENVEIYILKHRKFSDSFRFLFNLVWEQFTIIPDTPDHKPQKKKTPAK